MPLKRHGANIEQQIKEIPEKLRAEIPGTLEAIGVVIENEMKRLLNTPGRGRLRGGDRVGVGSFRRVAGKLKRVRRGVGRTNIDLTNRASAPGDPPAPDHGDLLRSVTHEPDGNTVRVGSPLEYAEPLENGTITAGRNHRTVILPRPWIRPAVSATKGQVDELVSQLFKKAEKR